ncbi:MAG: cell division protein SepF [Lachnospiraceae bacterium]|nr:cell division protein SepF [Lachnospiraceae bacterium]
MGMMDGIKNRFLMSGIIEDDDIDEFDDEDVEDDDFDEEESEPRQGLFGGLFKKSNSIEDEEDDIEDIPETNEKSRFNPKKPQYTSSKNTDTYEPAPKTFNPAKATAKRSYYEPEEPVKSEPVKKNGGGKVVSMSKASANNVGVGFKAMTMNELFMIKPKKEEDARMAVDALLAKKVVIINLEGLSIDIAQYVTDFVTGANYSIGGNFSTINSQVLVFTPAGIDLTGAFEYNQYDNGKEY